MTIETKYNIGDNAWFIGKDYKPHQNLIFAIHFSIDENSIEEKILLRGEYAPLFIPVKQVFPTKQDLINSL